MQRTLSHFDCIFSCAFHGCHYVGYQTQPIGISIEQVLKRSFAHVFGCDVDLLASSRTDSGVHSRDLLVRTSICRDHVERAMGSEHHSSKAIEGLVNRLNANLPTDVKISRLRWAIPSQIYLRGLVRGKQYSYYWRVGNWSSTANLVNYTAYEYGPVNVHAMSAAAADIVGEHDFFLFAASRKGGSKDESDDAITTRSVYSSEISVLTPREFNYEALGDAPPANHTGIVIPPTFVESAQIAAESSVDATSQSGNPIGPNTKIPYPWILTTCPNERMPKREKKAGSGRLAASNATAECDCNLITEKSKNLLEKQESISETSATSGGDQLIHPKKGTKLSASGKYTRFPSTRNDFATSHSCTAEGRANIDIPCIIRFRITGNGFLRHQVRRLAGALMAVGKGKLTRDAFRMKLSGQVAEGHALLPPSEETRRTSAQEGKDPSASRETVNSESIITDRNDVKQDLTILKQATSNRITKESLDKKTLVAPLRTPKQERRPPVLDFRVADAQGLWLERTFLFDFAPYELSRTLAIRQKYNLPYLYDAFGNHAIHQQQLTLSEDDKHPSCSNSATRSLLDTLENSNESDMDATNLKFWTDKYWCNNRKREYHEDHGICPSSIHSLGFEGEEKGTAKWGHGTFSLETLQSNDFPSKGFKKSRNDVDLPLPLSLTMSEPVGGNDEFAA